MASRKTPAPPTATDEFAAAQALAASVKGPRPGAPPLQQAIPPVSADPIVVAAPREEPQSTPSEFPRLMRVVFREKMTFDHSMFATSEINMESGLNLGTDSSLRAYKRLELCRFCGELTVLIERNRADGASAVFRVPYNSLALVQTYEDNPVRRNMPITVNEGKQSVGMDVRR